MPDIWRLGCCLIDHRFHSYRFASPVKTIRGKNCFGVCIYQAGDQRSGTIPREKGKNHPADFRNCQQGNHNLGHHRHK